MFNKLLESSVSCLLSWQQLVQFSIFFFSPSSITLVILSGKKTYRKARFSDKKESDNEDNGGRIKRKVER